MWRQSGFSTNEPVRFTIFKIYFFFLRLSYYKKEKRSLIRSLSSLSACLPVCQDPCSQERVKVSS